MQYILLPCMMEVNNCHQLAVITCHCHLMLPGACPTPWNIRSVALPATLGTHLITFSRSRLGNVIRQTRGTRFSVGFYALQLETAKLVTIWNSAFQLLLSIYPLPLRRTVPSNQKAAQSIFNTCYRRHTFACSFNCTGPLFRLLESHGARQESWHRTLKCMETRPENA